MSTTTLGTIYVKPSESFRAVVAMTSLRIAKNKIRAVFIDVSFSPWTIELILSGILLYCFSRMASGAASTSGADIRFKDHHSGIETQSHYHYND
jgi:hypothetical protein